MKTNKKVSLNSNFTEFLLYTTPNDKVNVEIFLRDENIWLTQKLIARLFDCSSDNVSFHLKNIFESGELLENSVTEEFSVTAGDGKKYKTKHYNLDAIISVGYRVNSVNATQFRIWATERLKEYIIKGFTMDDERLKNPNMIFGKDYFEEQLARIRNIRSSERRMYQKVTDIYAECSADYSPNSDITKEFFATVQNKLHFAITGKTAAEIIYERVKNEKPNIGLTSWKNSPKGKIRETDVIIAKNYLNEKELDHLNRIVTMYLDFAEMQAKRGVLMRMKDWISKLDAFLKFNEQEILSNAGKINHEVAEALAFEEYEKYRIEQDKNYVSDFDKEVKKILDVKKKQVNFAEKDRDGDFDKIERQVHLYTIKGAAISRSQAREILVGLEKFKIIVFDFDKVPTVGQAFADEIFRVFHNKYPHIKLETENMIDSVKFMIERSQHMVLEQENLKTKNKE